MPLGRSSQWKYKHDSGLEGIWGGIPLRNSLQLRTRKTPRAVSEDGKRKRMPSFSAYRSELVVSCQLWYNHVALL